MNLVKLSNSISYLIFVFFCGVSFTFGQIRSYNQAAGSIPGSSSFLDASSNTFSNSTNRGKGLAFPRTDLTTFTITEDGNIISFPTYYDGMVVYNTATGVTPATGSGVGGEPTINNQEAELALLRRILAKMTAVREAVNQN